MTSLKTEGLQQFGPEHGTERPIRDRLEDGLGEDEVAIGIAPTGARRTDRRRDSLQEIGGRKRPVAVLVAGRSGPGRWCGEQPPKRAPGRRRGRRQRHPWTPMRSSSDNSPPLTKRSTIVAMYILATLATRNGVAGVTARRVSMFATPDTTSTSAPSSMTATLAPGTSREARNESTACCSRRGKALSASGDFPHATAIKDNAISTGSHLPRPPTRSSAPPSSGWQRGCSRRS